MLYNIVINQKAVIDNKWNLDLYDISVFDAMHKILYFFPDIKSIIHDNKEWFWINYDLIRQQLPLIQYQDNWYRNTIKRLQDCGLIDIYPDNQKLGKTYFRLGKNAHKMFLEVSVNNIQEPPLKQVDPSTQTSATPPLKRVDNNYTNYNKEDNIEQTEKTFEERLPTLPQVIEFAKSSFNDNIWVEQTCMSLMVKTKEDLKEWMRAFNLHIANTENIVDMTLRKYKTLFIGWMRMKNSKGVKLSDFKTNQNTNEPKHRIAPPLTRLI